MVVWLLCLLHSAAALLHGKGIKLKLSGDELHYTDDLILL